MTIYLMTHISEAETNYYYYTGLLFTKQIKLVCLFTHRLPQRTHRKFSKQWCIMKKTACIEMEIGAT